MFHLKTKISGKEIRKKKFHYLNFFFFVFLYAVNITADKYWFIKLSVQSLRYFQGISS